MTAGFSSNLLSVLLMPVSKFRPWPCQEEKKEERVKKKRNYMNVSFVVSVHIEGTLLFPAKNMQ